MQLLLWSNFSKRGNSTKQPARENATYLDVKLKTPTSIERPTFILEGNIENFNYNYCYAFGHYYHITNITSLAYNLLSFDCDQDVLATYKNEILSTSQFVERSSSNYNIFLPDPNVSINNKEQITEQIISQGVLFNESGLYIISVLNDVGSGAGFTTYYIIDRFTIQELATYCNQNLGTQSTSVLQWLQATFLKTADAIIDCKWLPLSVQSLAGLSGLQGDTLKIGKDLLPGLTGLRFTDTVIKHFEWSIDCNWRYSDFRLGQPYTKAFLFIPFYGIYQFNALDFKTKIKFLYDLDVATGDITLYLKNEDNKLIATLNYNIGVTAPVGKVGNQAGSVIGSTLATIGSTIGAFASSGATAAAGFISATASGINTISSASAISPSVKGSLAGRSMALNGLDIHLIEITNDTTNPANLVDIVGRPLMEYRTLSGLTGYVQTSQASIDIASLANDRETINTLLNSGIYIE